MSIIRKINSRAKSAVNTGFGTSANSYGGRFLNKDGQANIKKTGLGFLEKYSWFHSMLAVSGTHFFLIILLFFVSINLVFAVVYYLLGTEYLSGMNVESEIDKFGEAFFFSAQTFTTVGYGRISPTGFLTSAISSFQALIGLLSFAVATGLMYGRFSQPRAFLKYSHNAIIAPYKNGKALMIRLAPYKNTALSDAECRLTLGISENENGAPVNKFYQLELELDKINILTLSWTLVHPINENSPLYQFTKEDFEKVKGELMVFIKAFDDKFSNTVVSRTSYIFPEIVYGAKFQPMFQRGSGNQTTVLNLEKLNLFEKVEFPVEA